MRRYALYRVPILVLICNRLLWKSEVILMDCVWYTHICGLRFFYISFFLKKPLHGIHDCPKLLSTTDSLTHRQTDGHTDKLPVTHQLRRWQRGRRWRPRLQRPLQRPLRQEQVLKRRLGSTQTPERQRRVKKWRWKEKSRSQETRGGKVERKNKGFEHYRRLLYVFSCKSWRLAALI